MNPWNSDPSFNKITSSYFKDLIDLSGNFIIRNGTIKSPANTIEFDDEFSFINIPNSLNVLTQLKVNYDSVEYDVGLQCEKTDTLVSDVATLSPIVSDTAFKCTNFYYDQALNSTIFSNNVSFGNGTIASIAINNSSFVDLTNTQTIGGAKTFSLAPTMSGANINAGTIPVNRVSGGAVNLTTAQSITATKSYSVVQNFNNNIRLDGSLLLSLGTITLTNADLQKIAFINTATSNIQTQINNITSSSILASASNVFTGATNQFSNTLRLDGALNLNANALVIPNTTLQKLQYISTLSSDVQTQINTLTTNSVSLSASNVFTGATNQFTNNIRLDGSLIVNSNGTTLTNSTLNKIQYLSNVSSDVNTSITNINTSVTTLNTKTTKMSYMSVGGINTTTILDGLISQTFSFTGTINNISTTTFGYINSLTSNAQAQLTNLATKLTAISYEGSNTTTTIAGDLIFLNNLNSISATTFGYLSGLTSSIQNQLNSLSTRIATFELVGTIIMSPLSDLQSTSSNKYLFCNGGLYNRTVYSALFAKIGTNFGTGDGLTDFRVPDYRGLFLRGTGSQVLFGVNYTGGAVNNPQQDSMENHNHLPQDGAYLGTITSASNSGGYLNSPLQRPNQYSFGNTGDVVNGRNNEIETRPVNVGIYYYIKS